MMNFERGTKTQNLYGVKARPIVQILRALQADAFKLIFATILPRLSQRYGVTGLDSCCLLYSTLFFKICQGVVEKSTCPSISLK